MRVLLCDDDKDILNALRIYLEQDGYETLLATNGQEALALLQEQTVDCLVLDVMMPKLDGMQTLLKLRQKHDLPVIFLSAKTQEEDKIFGLDLGADDYITKPFSPQELLARIRSNIRRYHRKHEKIDLEMLRIGDLELDDRAKRVCLEGQEIRLTPTEYAILKLLMEHQGTVFSPAQIHHKLYREVSSEGAESSIPVHIRHLREKIELNPSEPRYLKVVWGHGYKIDER